MKHQALARAFAVVLAIMCLLMLLNGATGFGKAAKAHEERTAFEVSISALEEPTEEAEASSADEETNMVL